MKIIIKHRAALICHILPILAAIFLVGCSGPPSESMGRKMLEHKIQSQSNGKINLASFKKTNGTGDNNFYQVEYEAEIEFLADGAWVRGSSLDSSVSFEFSTQQVGGNWMAQSIGGVTGATNVKQGQHTTIKGVLKFERTEKGWRGEDGVVY
jgi:PBP1b-binding outer membrane lipoprotein LpoB